MDDNSIRALNESILRGSQGGRNFALAYADDTTSHFGRLVLVFLVSWFVLYLASYHCMLKSYSSRQNGRPCGARIKRRYLKGTGCASMFFALVIVLIVHFCGL